VVISKNLFYGMEEVLSVDKCDSPLHEVPNKKDQMWMQKKTHPGLAASRVGEKSIHLPMYQQDLFGT
jgi:hypothetical protein